MFIDWPFDTRCAIMHNNPLFGCTVPLNIVHTHENIGTSHTGDQSRIFKKLHKTNVCHVTYTEMTQHYRVWCKEQLQVCGNLTHIRLPFTPPRLALCLSHTHLAPAYSCQRQIYISLCKRTYFPFSCWLEIRVWSVITVAPCFDLLNRMRRIWWSMGWDRVTDQLASRPDHPGRLEHTSKLPHPAPVTASCSRPLASSTPRVPAQDRDQDQESMMMAKMREKNKVQCQPPEAWTFWTHLQNWKS